MSIQMDANFYISIILIIGAVQGFFLSIIPLTLKRGNQAANRTLGIIILLFMLMLLPHTKMKHTEDPQGEYIIHILFFLLPPLIYYYVKLLTGNFPGIKFKNSIHFLPFTAGLIIFISLLLFDSTMNTWRTAVKIITVMLVIQMTVYLYYSIKLLRSYQENIRQSFSYIERINLNWLKFLLMGQIIIWPLFLAAEYLNLQPGNYSWILVAVFIYLLGYFSITQPEIMVGMIHGFNLKSNEIKKKYAKSALTPEASIDYYKRLIKFMEGKKPYLQNNLTLANVIHELSVSTHHLSQVINEQANLNFFEFINKYRIEEAKKLLKCRDKEYLSIAAISFEAGFNSVSSFNSVFKKMIKMTPSEFRTLHNSKA
jgi:AraC-like DNA-binding protein